METWGRGLEFKGAKITETLSSPGGPTDDESESTGTLAFYAYVLSPLVTSEQLKQNEYFHYQLIEEQVDQRKFDKSNKRQRGTKNKEKAGHI